MESIIKKAIEGGYPPIEIINEGRMYRTSEFEWQRSYELFSSRFFWESLGIACEWDGCKAKDVDANACISYGENKGSCTYFDDSGVYHALRFHEINLTEGWDAAIAYLIEVTK